MSMIIKEDIVTIGKPNPYGSYDVNAQKVVETASMLFEHVDYEMAAPLRRAENNENAASEIEAYLRALRVENPIVIIKQIRVELNNYFEKLGISLLSAKITVEDPEDETVSLPTDLCPPTLGVAKCFRGEKPILAGFKVEGSGAERIRIASEKFTARGFVHGEQMTDPQTIGNPLRRSEASIIIPRTEMIGVGVSSIDNCETLRRLQVPHARLICDEEDKGGGVYFCRYLTHEAAAKILGLTLS